MRRLTTAAVLTAAVAMGYGGPAHASPPSTPSAVGFTPPIGTNHGSVVGPEAPLRMEMDLIWW